MYIYAIAFGLVLLSVIQIIDAFKEKRWIKFSCLLLVIGISLFKPLCNLVTHTVIVKEEFRENINLEYAEGNTKNIILKTKEKIEEPIDLRVKDSWAHLTYLTDYEIGKNKKTVKIGYEFGNNKDYNKMIAGRGLVFTYKTIRIR